MNEPKAYKARAYDISLPMRDRLKDFLGAYHIVLNGVKAHEPFDLRYENKPEEMCDTEDKDAFIKFVELLVAQQQKQDREKIIHIITDLVESEYPEAGAFANRLCGDIEKSNL